MGLLIDGEWHDQWYDTKNTGGKFKRQASAFRNTIDGETYTAEAGRYRLYVSYACPWAHRTLILRALKGLEEVIDIVVVEPLMKDKGWILPNGDPLHTIYTRASADYTGRVTVPVLWDTRTNSIVNNESAEIIRILNRDFNDFATRDCPDLYPEDLREDIDAINDWIYRDINNGVYRAGFATTQEAYEEAFDALFAALDRVENILSEKRYLLGNQLTEADWRLFTTLLRFDPVYVGHFKCNLKRIVDYPNIWGYLRELYQIEGVKSTVHMDHIKTHYYASHDMINPTGVVPKGPEIDLSAPHGRD